MTVNGRRGLLEETRKFTTRMDSKHDLLPNDSFSVDIVASALLFLPLKASSSTHSRPAVYASLRQEGAGLLIPQPLSSLMRDAWP